MCIFETRSSVCVTLDLLSQVKCMNLYLLDEVKCMTLYVHNAVPRLSVYQRSISGVGVQMVLLAYSEDQGSRRDQKI